MNIKKIRDIQLGDYTIYLREHDDGHCVVKLTSAQYGNLLEMEKRDNGKIRMHELDVGSTEILVEHLALMLVLIGAGEEVASEMERINKIRHHEK